VRKKCSHCHQVSSPSGAPAVRTQPKKRAKLRPAVVAGVAAALLMLLILVAPLGLPVVIHWPDRRPIGMLFLASYRHSSATNPRGWFNDPALNVVGADGADRFRTALLAYADRSIGILKRIGAQGVLVWDLEGEQFPHKTTFIGDPRLLGRLAPEMEPVADEFFARFRRAGFRVGLTVRPQQLVFDADEFPRQEGVFNLKRSLLAKIDYARTRWQASLFYIDSNGGIRRPDEAWQLRSLAAERPDVLLIPEHHDLLYSSFSGPYFNLRRDPGALSAAKAARFFGQSFRVLDIGDATNDLATIANAHGHGDILLFRAWYWNRDCDLLDRLTPPKP